MTHDGPDGAGTELVVFIVQGGFQRVASLCNWVDGEVLSGSSLSRDGAVTGISCTGGEGMQASGSGPLATVIGRSTDEAGELSPCSMEEGQMRGGGRD